MTYMQATEFIVLNTIHCIRGLKLKLIFQHLEYKPHALLMKPKLTFLQQPNMMTIINAFFYIIRSAKTQ